MLTLLILCCGGILAQGVGNAASTADRAGDVAVLVRRLDAPSLAEREAAERQLLDFGPEILPLLPEEEVTPSAEVRLRVRRIRRLLEQIYLLQAAGTSRVTLHAAERPLGEILQAIERQTCNRILLEPQSLGQQPVSVAFQGTPFWQAIDRLAADQGLVLTAAPTERGLLLRPRETDDPPAPLLVGYQGPLRLALRPFEPLHEVERVVGFELHLLWEPRVRVIRLVLPMASLRGEARLVHSRNDSIPLEPTNPKAVLEIPGDETSIARSVRVNFRRPTVEPFQPTELSGSLDVLACGPVKRFTFDAAARAVGRPQRAGEVVVELAAISRLEDVLEAVIGSEFARADDAFASHRVWFYENEARLRGPLGTVIEPRRARVDRQYETGVRMAYSFDLPNDLAGYTLTYETPIAVQSRELVFRLTPYRVGSRSF